MMVPVFRIITVSLIGLISLDPDQILQNVPFIQGLHFDYSSAWLDTFRFTIAPQIKVYLNFED